MHSTRNLHKYRSGRPTREMLQIGAPGCENIRGSTLHSLCMRILSRESVLQAVGRTPRPLNKFELEPLLYDLSTSFGDKRARSKRIRAYEAAWARLQHEMPGHAQMQRTLPLRLRL